MRIPFTTTKVYSTFIFLFILLFVLFVLSISLGAVYIPPSETLHILCGKASQKPAWETIVMDFRLPKSITAILVGAGLSMAGIQMQTLFRNPLAGPYVLGISSGASLGVAVMMMGASLFHYQAQANAWQIVIAAIMGAVCVLLLIMSIATHLQNNMALLIVGLMLGSATSAIVNVLEYFSSAKEIQNYTLWTFGSLGGITWDKMPYFVLCVLTGLLIGLSLHKSLNALLLGENYAISMGLDIQKVRIGVMLSAGLLAGGITAFCGPIGFVGLAVPHVAKLLFDSANHKILLPAVCLIGATVMLLCDILCVLPSSEKILPINAITALLGSPIVIVLIIKKGEL